MKQLTGVLVPDPIAAAFERSQEFVQRYFSEWVHRPESGTIAVHGERYILVRAAAMSVEFFEELTRLFRSQGEHEATAIARGLLYDLAHTIGRADARAFAARLGVDEPVDRFSAGPSHFAHTGWATVELDEGCEMYADERYLLVYDHPCSFEADAWLASSKRAGAPACVMNAGYSSGWCEEAFGIPLAAVEVECRARGDRRCRFVMAHAERIDAALARLGLRDAVDPRAAGEAAASSHFGRRRLEQALRRSERRFEDMAMCTASWVWEVDADGRLTYLRGALEETLGYREQELLGRTPDELLPETDRARLAARFRAIAGEGRPITDQVVWAVRRDGRRVCLLCNGVPVQGRDGELRGYRGVVKDITRDRELEERLAEADRLASLGMLAAGIGHEINNPLAYTVGNLDLVKERLPALLERQGRYRQTLARLVRGTATVEQAREVLADADADRAEAEELLRCARDAAHGAGRVQSIMRDLREFSSVPARRGASANLLRVIRSAINLSRNELRYRARLVTELGEVPPVSGEESRLAQVFVNLLVNAAQAVERGGSPEPEIRVRTWVDGETVAAEVRDSGQGLTPEEREHLFDPFSAELPPGVGSGLSLSVTRNIVTSFGGTIEVDSAPGRGTGFIVRLPRPDGAAGRTAGGPAARAEPRRARILVVDDEPMVCKTVRRWLGREHDVVLAESAEEAERVLAQDHGFDLVLSDLIMPGRSGMELYEHCREHHPRLAPRFVFMSGGAFTQRARVFLERVPNPRLDKPIDMRRLGAQIQAWLDEL